MPLLPINKVESVDSVLNQYITKKPDWVERKKEGEDKIYVAQNSFSFFLHFLIPFIFSFLVIELYFILEEAHQRSSNVTPSSEQAWLDQLAQGSIRLTLGTWELPMTNCTRFLGKVFQHLMTLTVQFFLLISTQNFPCPNLSPLPPVLSLCTSENSLAPFTLYPAVRLLLKASIDFPKQQTQNCWFFGLQVTFLRLEESTEP